MQLRSGNKNEWKMKFYSLLHVYEMIWILISIGKSTFLLFFLWCFSVFLVVIILLYFFLVLLSLTLQTHLTIIIVVVHIIMKAPWKEREREEMYLKSLEFLYLYLKLICPLFFCVCFFVLSHLSLYILPFSLFVIISKATHSMRVEGRGEL